MSLNISDAEWRKAEAFFADPKNEKAVKMRKPYRSSTEHSFVKIEGKIYGIGNKRIAGEAPLGAGGFNKIKLAQTRGGKLVALRVSQEEDFQTEDAENVLRSVEIKNTVGDSELFFKGRMVRELEPKEGKKNRPKRKTYSVLYKIRGETFFDSKYELEKLSDNQKLIIALKCCQCLRNLQDQRIVHGDITLSNFMKYKNNNGVGIFLLDFDSSLKLKDDESVRKSLDVRGDQDYMAPELVDKNEYSLKSDIYSLGIVFRNFAYVKDEKQLMEEFAKMLSPSPERRPDLDKVISTLVSTLAKKTDLTEDERAIVDQEKKRMPSMPSKEKAKAKTSEDVSDTPHEKSGKQKFFSMRGLRDLVRKSKKEDNDEGEQVSVSVKAGTVKRKDNK